MSKVVTRFAPSPTGELHIGGARTALFNWLYARHTGGKFLLRIEDTDRARSSDQYVRSIQDQLLWLGLGWDDDVVSQFDNSARHVEVANQLVAMGKAYYCYASKDDLDQLRKEQEIAKVPYRYDGRWRDRDPATAPLGVSPVVRIKAAQTGKTTIDDLVQGTVTVDNSTLDDMVLLRADGTPTYMLAVVVDDHDSGVTHIIRGDDHLNNVFRQLQIITAMGWDIPTYAHIPLIHGEDGKKLSKRNVAPSVNSYKDAGYLPDAVCNYMLRMGWGHGNDEIISVAQAIEWFDVVNVSKGASRLDPKKLAHINSVYMKDMDKDTLMEMIIPIITSNVGSVSDMGMDRINRGFNEVLIRSRTVNELASNFKLYAIDGLTDDMLVESTRYITDINRPHLLSVLELFINFDRTKPVTHNSIETMLRWYTTNANISFGSVALPLRSILTGAPISPSLFEVIYILGIDETIERLGQALNYSTGG